LLAEKRGPEGKKQTFRTYDVLVLKCRHRYKF